MHDTNSQSCWSGKKPTGGLPREREGVEKYAIADEGGSNHRKEKK